MRKIVIIQDHLNYGGVETCNINLANRLVELGHQVELTTILNSQLQKNKLDRKVNLTTLNSMSVSGSLSSLIKLFRKTDADIVISGKEYVNIFAVLAHKLSLSKVKHLAVIHTDLEDEFKYKTGKKDKIVKVLSRYAYRYADILGCVSKQIADKVKKHYRLSRKIETLYNPVSLSQDYNSSLKQVKELQAEGKKVIIACGRLTLAKNHKFLLDEFAAALARNNNLHLIILGDGELRSNIETQIKKLAIANNVTLQGAVDNPKDYFATADIFVHTSLYEGFGIVVVEALSTGAKILTTNIPTMKELLECGKYGIISEKSFSKDILIALDSSFDKNANIERANDFSIENSTQAYIDLIERECS